jgi:alanyl-tRNA synthetase
MKTNEIRQKYLEFFKRQGHTVCASDVLVPKWDPTVLFTPAGMNPFKDHFLGKVKLEFTRATSCQKCLRTGDIENVGRTAYHHTFFEMLGNFSFGDYFKREAIHWAWEFLTDKSWLGIDPARLTVSVYLEDDEASEIWHHEIGLPLDRIARLGEHDNFWPAAAPSEGPDGVCGPCSEIFFHPDNGPECEIWNLVFTQFNRRGNPPDNLEPLPSKNIDTGMGLERIAAVMQGVTTNFHIDSLMPLVLSAAEACHVPYRADSENGRRLRRIADHVRACTMAIHENVYPDKQKENYTVRRLLRRGVLQGYEMGLRDPFLYRVVPAVVESMREPYPELTTTIDNVMQVMRTEEEGFFRMLDTGRVHVDRIFEQMDKTGSTSVNGREAFNLYQEQGVPAELLESMASSRGYQFDWPGYNEAREQHALESGAGEVGVMGDFGPVDIIKRDVKSTGFLGYASVRHSAKVVGLVAEASVVDQIVSGGINQAVVLDCTPFYATAGGQVADTGTLAGPDGCFAVTDVEKSGDVFFHYGHVSQGRIRRGDEVIASVDEQRRRGIERAHSATHILHFALQKYLGEHAQQRGSKVEQDQLRFDFANQQSVPPAELAKIESEALACIAAGSAVRAEIIPMNVARERGAMMLFGEKYPDPVRMVSIGDYSRELCGGTHVANTAEIGEFEIVAEEATSAGTRRITALTGEKARQSAATVTSIATQLAERLGAADPLAAVRQLSDRARDLRKQLSTGRAAAAPPASRRLAAAAASTGYREQRESVRQIARVLNVPIHDIPERVDTLQAEIAELTRKVDEMQNLETLSVTQLLEQLHHVDGVDLIVSEVPGANAATLRDLADQIRKANPVAAVFLATIQDSEKVLLVAGLGVNAVKRGLSAGNWVKFVAPTVGGGGGGKPDFAQAGGKDPDKLHVALDAARQFIASAVAT